jgi:hypothetical protein
MTDTSLYDTDIVAWADRQVEELRRLAEAGVTNAVDWANVIEEIESVGRSERHAVESLLINALTHLLKMVGDPDSLSARAWRQEIVTFLDQAARRVTGSARAGLDLEELWRDALARARSSLELYDRALPPDLPTNCPFVVTDLLGKEVDVDALIATLRTGGRGF